MNDSSEENPYSSPGSGSHLYPQATAEATEIELDESLLLLARVELSYSQKWITRMIVCYFASVITACVTAVYQFPGFEWKNLILIIGTCIPILITLVAAFLLIHYREHLIEYAENPSANLLISFFAHDFIYWRSLGWLFLITTSGTALLIAGLIYVDS